MNELEIFEEMKRLHSLHGKLSAVLLQRKLKISFEKAEKYIKEFEYIIIKF